MSDEITINIKGPSELKLSLTVPLTLLTSELKTKIQEETQIEPERQRLIYSGKVLKDEEPLSTYKVQNGHSLHLVKGAAKPGSTPAATSSATSTSAPDAAAAAQARGVPTNLNAGLPYANNPLAQLEGAMGHGFGGGTYNPFAQMPGFDGQNLNDPNAMSNMLNNPEAISQAMSMITPEMMDQIIASNPQLSSMGPQVREMMRSPMMRQMMSDPAMIRQMMQMQGGMGGGSSPFGGMGGAGGGGAPNPLVAAFGAQAGADAGATLGSPAAAPGANAGAANPFGMNSEMMRNLMGMGMGGGAGGAGGAGGFGGLGALAGLGGMGGFGGFGAGAPGANAQPAAEALPQDTRSLEDRFSNQLRTLNEMGLVDPQQNLRALSMTGGNVEAAIELIFGGRKFGRNLVVPDDIPY